VMCGFQALRFVSHDSSPKVSVSKNKLLFKNYFKNFRLNIINALIFLDE